MRRGKIVDFPVSPAIEEAPEPLVRLRITGRHGVFLLEQSAEFSEEVLVDSRAPGGARCTCQGPAGSAECSHIALLRACGFLPRAA